VAQYLINPHGEVDGLLLDGGIQVHFPPHMGKDVAAAVKPDDQVSVQGYRTGEGPVVKAEIITNVRSGESIMERESGLLDRPLVPPPIRNLSLLERHAEGIVQVLLYGPRGDINGAVLEDRTILRIPPHAAYQFRALLQVGQSLNAVGYGTKNEYGQVIEVAALGASGAPMAPIDEPGSRRARP
jgi:hypothetical protein